MQKHIMHMQQPHVSHMLAVYTCVGTACSLSFYALTVLSGHQYILLSDLKVLATCLLSCFVLRQQLSRTTVLSIGGLFLGVCTGQYSTMRATAGSLWTLAAGADFLTAGFLLMLVISAVSAVSSVYTEWLMNYSRFRHESLNVQNMRLYAVGVLLNAAYYWHSGGQLEGFLLDVRGLHWLVVLLLALMGLFTVSRAAAVQALHCVHECCWGCYHHKQQPTHSNEPCADMQTCIPSFGTSFAVLSTTTAGCAMHRGPVGTAYSDASLGRLLACFGGKGLHTAQKCTEDVAYALPFL